MILRQIVEALDLRVAAGQERLDVDVSGGYAADLLSCAMAGASKGDLWITLQGHLNIVAVASLNELAGVIVTESRPVSSETCTKADEEGIVILQTPMTSYEMVGRLWDLGVR